MARRKISTEIEIEAPASTVWAALTDWPCSADWNPLMQSIEGKLELGARIDVSLKLGEREMQFRPTIVLVEEGRSFRWLGHTFVRGLFDGEHALEIEPREKLARFLFTPRGSAASCPAPGWRSSASKPKRGFEA